MLKQLQNAPGIVPVIINIRPLINFKQFLGIDSMPLALPRVKKEGSDKPKARSGRGKNTPSSRSTH